MAGTRVVGKCWLTRHCSVLGVCAVRRIDLFLNDSLTVHLRRGLLRHRDGLGAGLGMSDVAALGDERLGGLAGSEVVALGDERHGRRGDGLGDVQLVDGLDEGHAGSDGFGDELGGFVEWLGRLGVSLGGVQNTDGGLVGLFSMSSK